MKKRTRNERIARNRRTDRYFFETLFPGVCERESLRAKRENHSEGTRVVRGGERRRRRPGSCGVSRFLQEKKKKKQWRSKKKKRAQLAEPLDRGVPGRHEEDRLGDGGESAASAAALRAGSWLSRPVFWFVPTSIYASGRDCRCARRCSRARPR